MGHIMLWFYIGSILRWYFLLCFVFLIFAGYAYRVNAKRPEDDPKKKNFRPTAIFLAPITWPFLILGFILLFILKAVLYGIFLVILTIALVVVRKPFIFVWLDKIATKIGNILLEANTRLLNLNPMG